MKSVYSKCYLLSTRKTQITAKKPWKAAVFSIISGKIAKKTVKISRKLCVLRLSALYIVRLVRYLLTSSATIGKIFVVNRGDYSQPNLRSSVAVSYKPLRLTRLIKYNVSGRLAVTTLTPSLHVSVMRKPIPRRVASDSLEYLPKG